MDALQTTPTREEIARATAAYAAAHPEWAEERRKLQAEYDAKMARLAQHDTVFDNFMADWEAGQAMPPPRVGANGALLSSANAAFETGLRLADKTTPACDVPRKSAANDSRPRRPKYRFKPRRRYV